MRALSAIDIALWDILGQACGQPIYRLLGGPVRESIPVYNTSGGPSYGALVGAGRAPRHPGWPGYGDIGAFNPQCKNRTPNVDRMASEGMKLTSFYAAPVCTPSRAQILTGCYAKRVGLPMVIFPAEAIGLSADADICKR